MRCLRPISELQKTRLLVIHERFHRSISSGARFASGDERTKGQTAGKEWEKLEEETQHTTDSQVFITPHPSAKRGEGSSEKLFNLRAKKWPLEWRESQTGTDYTRAANSQTRCSASPSQLFIVFSHPSFSPTLSRRTSASQSPRLSLKATTDNLRGINVSDLLCGPSSPS